MTPRLLLDEMFSPAVAAELRRHGHDVLAVADDAELRGMNDTDLWDYARSTGRLLVTENIKDFRPLLVVALDADHPGALFTSSRAFPRSRNSLGVLIEALHAWLTTNTDQSREQWLRPARS